MRYVVSCAITSIKKIWYRYYRYLYYKKIDTIDSGVVQTRRMSDARHGGPQHGSKKRKDLTRTGTTLLSTDIDRSTEHQYMDIPMDRTRPDPTTRKPDENLLQLVEKNDELDASTERKVMPEGLDDSRGRNGIE